MVSLSIIGMTGWVNPLRVAVRRPGTLSVARRWSGGAFFVGTPALVRHPFWFIIQRKPRDLDTPLLAGGWGRRTAISPESSRRRGGVSPHCTVDAPLVLLRAHVGMDGHVPGEPESLPIGGRVRRGCPVGETGRVVRIAPPHEPSLGGGPEVTDTHHGSGSDGPGCRAVTGSPAANTGTFTRRDVAEIIGCQTMLSSFFLSILRRQRR